MSLADIIVAALIAAILFFALRTVIKNKKKGCSCGCQNCPGNCMKKQ